MTDPLPCNVHMVYEWPLMTTFFSKITALIEKYYNLWTLKISGDNKTVKKIDFRSYKIVEWSYVKRVFWIDWSLFSNDLFGNIYFGLPTLLFIFRTILSWKIRIEKTQFVKSKKKKQRRILKNRIYKKNF